MSIQTRVFSKKSLLIVAIVFILLAMALLGFNWYQNYYQSNVLENEAVSVVSQDVLPGLPMRLIIPAINVDAPIINLGLEKDGSIAAPKGPNDVAWFQLGPRPGQKGSAILSGHFGPWKTGAKSVFDNLDKLEEGDKVYIKDDKGQTFSFTVHKSQIYKANESPDEVFDNKSGTRLNLITCNGDWVPNDKTYTNRLVVFTQAD